MFIVKIVGEDGAHAAQQLRQFLAEMERTVEIVATVVEEKTPPKSASIEVGGANSAAPPLKVEDGGARPPKRSKKPVTVKAEDVPAPVVEKRPSASASVVNEKQPVALTPEVVRDAAMKFTSAHGSEALVKMLRRFDAKRFSDIPAEKLPDFYREITSQTPGELLS